MVALELKPGETQTTEDPVVQLKLRAGEHRLSLSVLDADGRESKSVELFLIVKIP